MRMAGAMLGTALFAGAFGALLLGTGDLAGVPMPGTASRNPAALRAPEAAASQALRAPNAAPGSSSAPELPSRNSAATAPAAVAQASRERLEAWKRELPGGARRELVANPELARSRARLREIDARSLDALRELIEANGLSEASSAHDLDDGDGRFEPWELGFQIWEQGQLVLLALGPDPYASYGYALHTLPEVVAAFERLELLDLSGGELQQLPDAIGLLSQLRELRLAHNQLRALPESLGELPQLERLVLGANRIAALPRSMQGLDRLEELWLADNPLAELPAPLLELPALRRLDVSQSLGAAELPPERGLRELPELARAANLEALYVSGNRLCGAAASPARFDASAHALRGLGLQRCGGSAHLHPTPAPRRARSERTARG